VYLETSKKSSTTVRPLPCCFIPDMMVTFRMNRSCPWSHFGHWSRPRQGSMLGTESRVGVWRVGLSCDLPTGHCRRSCTQSRRRKLERASVKVRGRQGDSTRRLRLRRRHSDAWYRYSHSCCYINPVLVLLSPDPVSSICTVASPAITT